MNKEKALDLISFSLAIIFGLLALASFFKYGIEGGNTLRMSVASFLLFWLHFRDKYSNTYDEEIAFERELLEIERKKNNSISDEKLLIINKKYPHLNSGFNIKHFAVLDKYNTLNGKRYGLYVQTFTTPIFIEIAEDEKKAVRESFCEQINSDIISIHAMFNDYILSDSGYLRSHLSSLDIIEIHINAVDPNQANLILLSNLGDDTWTCLMDSNYRFYNLISG